MQIKELKEVNALNEARAELAKSGELSTLPSSITRAEILIAQRSDPFCKETIAKRLEEDRAVSEKMDGLLVRGIQEKDL